MLRVRLRILLLIVAHLPLLYAELSHIEEPSSVGGRDEDSPTSCEKGLDPNHVGK